MQPRAYKNRSSLLHSGSQRAIVMYMKGYYTLAEVAHQLDMSLWFVRHEIKRGRIRAMKLGKQYLVSHESFVEYVVARGGENPLAE